MPWHLHHLIRHRNPRRDIVTLIHYRGGHRFSDRTQPIQGPTLSGNQGYLRAQGLHRATGPADRSADSRPRSAARLSCQLPPAHSGSPCLYLPLSSVPPAHYITQDFSCCGLDLLRKDPQAGPTLCCHSLQDTWRLPTPGRGGKFAMSPFHGTQEPAEEFCPWLSQILSLR